LVALFLLGVFASELVSARATTTADVSLRLWPAGQGRIEATQDGRDLLTEPCDFGSRVRKGSADECSVTVAVGTPVTLKAAADPAATVPAGHEEEVPDFPVPNPVFVRWSKADCGTEPTCTFTPDADSANEFITALFTPLQLQVGVFGTGTLTFRGSDGTVIQPECPGAVGFGDFTCHARFAADVDVTIEASTTPAGWGAGCEPEAGPTSQRCTIGMANLRSMSFVSFDPQQPPLDPPFHLVPIVKVKLVGSGRGDVTGSGITCPSTCQAEIDYQKKVRLTAQERPGSTFDGWVGVCSTSRSCSFNAGSATEIKARFDTVATTTTAPTTTTTSATSPTTTRETTTASPTTTRATSTTTTTTTTTPRPRTRLGTVAVRGHGAKRVVAFVVIVDRPARATARLLKQGTTSVSASRTYRLAQGRNALRLNVPRKVRAGRYRLSVRVVTPTVAETVAKTLRLPR
jgi:hypothetical protein